MKIDEACIDHNVARLTDEMLSELYDWCGKSDNEENMWLVSMGEIRGMMQLANALKEVLKV